ncbi:hypothetical protein O181_042768 [Austropuccinia psidii MF-1]|uniref:Uncharacterized protein n=1 Tax=Austropuccinia psidii MF-1 TaxID=1389203 RepID=A0A9Q3DLR4_9BASI|nr:hypothetical protein [Austropuccinia psidii MF-1]
MNNKRLNLESHLEELGASFQRICLKEVPLKNIMVITKRWNPNRQFKLLEERETRIRENQAIIQAIEEQLKQTEPTLIPSGSQGVDQPNLQWFHTIQAPGYQWPRVKILHNPR